MAIIDLAFGLNVLYGIILITLGLFFAIVTYPLAKGLVKMNHFYGVRFPQSYSSDENWYKINAYGGKLLMIWGVLMAIAGACLLLIPIRDYTIELAIFIILMATMAAPILMAYMYARELKPDDTL